MSLRVIITEEGFENFRPITLTRPLAEVRSGAFTFRERVHRIFPNVSVSIMTRDIVARAFQTKYGYLINEIPDGKTPFLILNLNFKLRLDFRDQIRDFKVDMSFEQPDGDVFAVIIDGKKFPRKISKEELPECLLNCEKKQGIWDLVNINGEIIESDFADFFGPLKKGIYDKAFLYKSEHIYIGRDAEVCAGAVLDARTGPIIIDDGAIVRPNCVIEGPCYIGKNSRIVSGWLRPGNSIGPNCRIGGEIESSIFHGNSNKYHEGFIGHSYIGEWVNLGALTTTSDLKNNYGKIRVDFGDGEIDTGRIKVGSFIGDHTKTGIGCLLNSGTYIGVSVNHYGTGLTPKYIPSFSWGNSEGYVEYDIEKALETARTVMSRRGENLIPEEEQLLRKIHSRRTTR